MKKVELLSHIQGLSTILSSEITCKYMSQDSIVEMQKALEQMTEEYLDTYCAA